MSKQIQIIFTEADIAGIITAVQDCGAVFFYKGAFLSPDAAQQRMLDCMNSPASQFFIIPNALIGRITDHRLNTLLHFGIEFDGVTKGNALSRTYTVGRFYMQNPDSCPQLEELYQGIVRFVKKEFHCHPESRVYFSRGFGDNMEAKHLIAVHTNGRRILTEASQ